MNKITKLFSNMFVSESPIQLKKRIGPLVDDSRIYRSLRSYLNTGNNEEIEDPYKSSVWVFSSINAIAQNISRVPFCIFDETNKNKKNKIEKGILYDLFSNPNPYMIGSTLMFATVLFMELYGEAFWLLDGRTNITEVPKNIWVINPSRLEPVLDKDEKGNDLFRGFWKYTIGKENFILAPWEILHFKYFNPYDDIRGIAPLDASRLGVEQDYFANKYNKQFFKDGISLSGIIQVPEVLDDTLFNRIKDQFEERHSGSNNAHKVGVIEGGATFVETKSMSQRDMEYAVLKKVIRGEILAAFKTNEVVLGDYSQIQSYEGIKQAHESFWKETLVPKIIYLEEFLWSKFFSKVESGKFWGGWDLSDVEALREDLKLKIDMAKILNEIGYPINLINKRLDMGFENVKWGNTWYIRAGTIPVELAEDAITPDEPPKQDENEKPKDEPKDEPKEEKPKTDKDLVYWNNYIIKQISIENTFKSKLSKFFFEQRKRVLFNVFNKKEVIFDFDDEKEKLIKLFSSLYISASEASIELFNEELVIEKLVDATLINKFITKKLDINVSIVLNTINNNLKQLLLKYKELPIEDLAKKIREFYNKTDNRVFLIARTESASVINGIHYLLMLKNNVKYVKWLSKGEHGRHLSLQGKIIKLGESFSDKFILRYPLDYKAPKTEIIGCLCYIIPIIKY
jgi:HK97 family phage portal protein